MFSDKYYYLYKSINFSKKRSMIGLDASSSTFQIQGLLVKDELMLKLSNVLPNEKKQDIYKYVMEYFYENIKNSLNGYYVSINENFYKKNNVKV
jgi:hypothetical protein